MQKSTLCLSRLKGKMQKPTWQSLYLIVINARTYTQIHTPTVVQVGEGMEPSPRVFGMFQYFETVESL